jgi:hypothetical protein
MPPLTTNPIEPAEILKQSRQILQEAAAFTEKTFEKGQAYNTAIILAGFGGLFALLAATRDLMPKPWLAAIAGLIGISLLFFVGYVIYNMFIMSFAMLRSAKKQLENVLSLHRKAGVDTSSVQKALSTLRLNMWIWLVVWIVSVATGASAAALMLFFYATGILKI